MVLLSAIPPPTVGDALGGRDTAMGKEDPAGGDGWGHEGLNLIKRVREPRELESFPLPGPFGKKNSGELLWPQQHQSCSIKTLALTAS